MLTRAEQKKVSGQCEYGGCNTYTCDNERLCPKHRGEARERSRRYYLKKRDARVCTYGGCNKPTRPNGFQCAFHAMIAAQQVKEWRELDRKLGLCRMPGCGASALRGYRACRIHLGKKHRRIPLPTLPPVAAFAS